MHHMWRKWQNCIMSISYVELLWLCAMLQLSWKYTSQNPLPRYVSCWLQETLYMEPGKQKWSSGHSFNLKVGAGHTVGPVRVAADLSAHLAGVGWRGLQLLHLPPYLPSPSPSPGPLLQVTHRIKTEAGEKSMQIAMSLFSPTSTFPSQLSSWHASCPKTDSEATAWSPGPYSYRSSFLFVSMQGSFASLMELHW